jgi:hypothetical protein
MILAKLVGVRSGLGLGSSRVGVTSFTSHMIHSPIGVMSFMMSVYLKDANA